MTRIIDALDAVAAAIIAQKDYLTDLDRQIADGDHGINMARGFQAALDAVEEMDDTTKPGPVLYTIGKAFIRHVGGAAGPLYGIRQSLRGLRRGHETQRRLLRKATRHGYCRHREARPCPERRQDHARRADSHPRVLPAGTC